MVKDIGRLNDDQDTGIRLPGSREFLFRVRLGTSATQRETPHDLSRDIQRQDRVYSSGWNCYGVKNARTKRFVHLRFATNKPPEPASRARSRCSTAGQEIVAC